MGSAVISRRITPRTNCYCDHKSCRQLVPPSHPRTGQMHQLRDFIKTYCTELLRFVFFRLGQSHHRFGWRTIRKHRREVEVQNKCNRCTGYPLTVSGLLHRSYSFYFHRSYFYLTCSCFSNTGIFANNFC